MRYYHLSRQLNIRFKWVKGHADNAFNNRCDELATAAADGTNLLVDTGYELEQNGSLITFFLLALAGTSSACFSLSGLSTTHSRSAAYQDWQR